MQDIFLPFHGSKSERGILSKISFAAFAVAAMIAPLPAHAVTAEQLLHLLLKKGVITQEEFEILAADKTPAKEPASTIAPPAESKQPAAREAQSNPAYTHLPSGANGTTLTARFGDGITWSSEDQSTSISLRGRTETDYRHFTGADAANADTFDVRRVFLSAEGKLWDNYEFRLRANLAGLNGPTSTVCTAVGTSGNSSTPACTATVPVSNTSTSHLDEAWLNINWWPQAQFKFGQFKMPFSLEQMTTELYTDLMERNMGDVLTPGKERGMQVHGVPLNGVYYALAYSNGQGINANETVNTADRQDLVGRATFNLAELLGDPRGVYHLGGSYSRGAIPAIAAPSARTESRGIVFFTPSAFTGTEVDRKRYGFEAVLAYGPVKFQAEYVNANFHGTSDLGLNYDRDIQAYYGSLAWLITGEHYASAYRNGIIGRIRPKANFSPRGEGWGAWELAFRFSRFDASDFATTSAATVGSGVKPVTSANLATARALGLKWIVNPNTRFLFNYFDTHFDTPVTVSNAGATVIVDDERAINLRAQFDF